MSGYYAKVSNISGGKSCVATSAYMSREKLKDEQMNHTFNYSKHEHDNTFTNVTLCKGAPEEWQDKEKLWNAVEAEESGKNTRKAKQWILAVPQGMSKEQAQDAVKEFQSYLAEKGMCSQADIHEPESKRSKIEKNVHVHVLATQRLIDEKGEWVKNKQKQEYANDIKIELTDKGEKREKPFYNPEKDTKPENRIPKVDPAKVAEWEEQNGAKFSLKEQLEEISKIENPEERATARKDFLDKVQKIGERNRREWTRCTTENNPLYKKELIEESRAKWAEVCNKHLSAEQQIDHRSYERQGIDRVSEIHEGIGYHQQDERAEYNKAVQELNSTMETLKAQAPQELEQIRSEVDGIRESLEYDTVSKRTAESDQRTAGADQGIERPTRTAGTAYMADRAGAYEKGAGAEERNLGTENSDQKTASRSDTERRYRSGDRELAETVRVVEERGRAREEESRQMADVGARIERVRERIAGIRTSFKGAFERLLKENIQRLADALNREDQRKAQAEQTQQQPKESIMARLNRLQQVNQENREKQAQDEKQTEQSRTQAILERAKQANEQQRAETAQNGAGQAETNKGESIRDKLQRATEKAQEERKQAFETEQQLETQQESQTFRRRRGPHR